MDTAGERERLLKEEAACVRLDRGARLRMRITVSHNKSKEEVMRAVDRSFDDLFRGVAGLPLKIVNEQRSWQGSTLNFSFNAKMGLLSSPIKGFVEVTDKDVTVDADLGLLEKLLPAKSASSAIESKIKGLLN